MLERYPHAIDLPQGGQRCEHSGRIVETRLESSFHSVERLISRRRFVQVSDKAVIHGQTFENIRERTRLLNEVRSIAHRLPNQASGVRIGESQEAIRFTENEPPGVLQTVKRLKHGKRTVVRCRL